MSYIKHFFFILIISICLNFSLLKNAFAYINIYKSAPNDVVCKYSYEQDWFKEAERRGLYCYQNFNTFKKSSDIKIPRSSMKSKSFETNLELNIYESAPNDIVCKYSYENDWFDEARRRGITCNSITSNFITNNVSSKRPLGKLSDTVVCYNATISSSGKTLWNDRNENFVGEAKYRNLTCGVKVNQSISSFELKKEKEIRKAL